MKELALKGKLDTLVMLLTERADDRCKQSKSEGTEMDRKLSLLYSALDDMTAALDIRSDGDASLEERQRLILGAISDLENLSSVTKH